MFKRMIGPLVFLLLASHLGAASVSIDSVAGPTVDGRFDFTFSYTLTTFFGAKFESWQQKPDGSWTYWNPRVDYLTGTFTDQVSTGCWPEGQYERFVRVSDINGSAEASVMVVVPPHPPTASVQLDLSVPQAPTATVTWDFPHTANGSQRWVGLYWEPLHTIVWQTSTNAPRSGSAGPISLGTCSVDGKETLRVVAVGCIDPSNPSNQTIFESNGGVVTLPKCEVTCETCKDGKTVQTKCKNPAECAGKPVRVTSGNMRMSDLDPLPGGLARTYDSKRTSGMLGRGWTSIFESSLRAIGGSDGLAEVTIKTEDGERVVFLKTDGTYRRVWPVSLNVSAELEYDDVSGTYSYSEGPGAMARLFQSGRLVGLRSPAGTWEISISRDVNGLPVRIADSRGNWAWNVTTANGIVETIAVEGRPDLVWTYAHDGSGNLTSVTGPAGTWRTYTYGSAGMLTARDGTAKLLESHDYDGQGEATTSISDEGDITAIEHDLPGRVTGEWMSRVTYATGRTTLTYSRYIAGKMRTVEIDGSCDCGGEDSVYAYDAAGHVVRQQDSLGWITDRELSGDLLIQETSTLAPAGCDPGTDTNRCRLTPDALATTELVTTADTRVISWQYGSTAWPGLPTQIETSSVLAPGESRVRTLAYDNLTGTVLTDTLTGWTGSPAHEETRVTTTALYNGTEAAAFVPHASFEAWAALPQPLRNLRSVDGPRADVADVTTFVYYPIHESVPGPLRGRRAGVRNAAGHVTFYESYDVFGNLTRMTDPNGTVTEMAYDSLGRLSSTTVRKGGSCAGGDTTCVVTTTMTYDGAGPLSVETRPDGVMAYTWDDRGRIATVSRGPSSGDLREKIETTYDPATGKKNLERFLALESGSWVEKRRESFAYDTSGNLSRLTHADSTFVEYGYGPNARLENVRDERHASPNTFYDYDAEGRLAAVRQTLGAGAISTAYDYDLDGNLVSVTDPNGNTTTYLYDDFGQRLRQVSPVTGTTTNQYDAAGQLTSTADANGATTTRQYDVLGRVTSSVSARAGESETVTWIYDTAPYGVGRLASMGDPTGGTAYEYDHRGLLTKETKTIGSAQYETRFEYDAAGNRARMVYPSGRLVDYTFDFAGRPVTAATGSTPLVTSASYLPFGPATEIAFGNGTTRQMTFDARYQPVVNRLDGPAGTIAQYRYGHDAVGNITSIHDEIDSAWNRDFGYDDLNRLVTANGGTSLWGAGSYTYDAMGNMTASQLGAATTSFGYQGSLPKLASVTRDGVPRSVSYDSAGNEAVVGAESFGYSPRNHLATGGILGFGYDGRGVRTISTREILPEILSVAMNPASVTGGSEAVATVTLREPAGEGGVTISLASGNPAVSLPPSTTISVGLLSGEFTLSTTPVGTDANATITATVGSSTGSANLLVMAPRLTVLTLNQATVTGGVDLQGEITLDGPAPDGGTVVSLSSDNVAVAIPESVTVPAGQTSVPFSLTTATVEAEVLATITATRAEVTQTATVRVKPVELFRMTLVSLLPQGQTAVGTVTLTGPAPAGGALVELNSSAPQLSVPVSVMVEAGMSTATFTATASTVLTDTQVVVTASYREVVRTASVTITTNVPPVLASIDCKRAIVGSPLSFSLAATDENGGPITFSADGLPQGATLVDGLFSWTPSASQTGLNPVTFSASDGVFSDAETIQIMVGLFEPETSLSVGFSIYNQGRAPAGASHVRAYLSDCSPAAGNGQPRCSSQVDHILGTGRDTDLGARQEGLPPGTPDGDAAPPLESGQSAAYVAGFTAPAGFGRLAHDGDPANAAVSDAEGWFTLTATSESSSRVGFLFERFLWIESDAARDAEGNKIGESGQLFDELLANDAQSQRLTTRPPLFSELEQLGAIYESLEGGSGGGTPRLELQFLCHGVLKIRLDNAANESGVNVIGDDVTVRYDTTGLSGVSGALSPSTTYQDALALAGGFIIGRIDFVVDDPGLGTRRYLLESIEVAGAVVPAQAAMKRRAALDFGRRLLRTSIPAAHALLDDDAPNIFERDGNPVRQMADELHKSESLAPLSLSVAMRPVVTNGFASKFYLYTPGLNLLAETVESVTSPKPAAYEYVWFGGQPLAQIETQTGAVHWYFNDHLGTPMLTTDASGAVDWRVEREPYGAIYAVRAGAERHQPLAFPGQEDGGELSYNVFRWYRAGWGRYSQSDPVNLLLEPYSYATSNPIALVDPSGLSTVSFGPTKKHAVDIDYVYQQCGVSFGGGLKGCALLTAYEFKCECYCADGKKWYKAISVTADSIDVYYATNAVTDEIFPKGLIPPDAILAEEMKHVADFQAAIPKLKDSLDLVEQKPYKNKKSCEKGCKAAKSWTYEYIQKGIKAVDASHPKYYAQ